LKKYFRYAYFKSILNFLISTLLEKVNRTATTGILPVSALGTVLSNSTKGIKLRDVKHSWYFRHFKKGYFKLLHSSGGYLYMSEKASFQLPGINSSSQPHIMKRKCFSVHSWNPCWHLHSGCPSTKHEAWVPGWWLTFAHLWKLACVCGSLWWSEAASLSYQSVSSLDTGRAIVLFSHSNNCMSLSLFACSQLKYRPCVSQKREDGDLALSCHLACWP